MTEKENVYQALQNMGILYEVVTHPPAVTIEDADRFIEGKEGCRTKTLFLRNRNKKQCYLLIMDDAKRLDMKKAAALLEEKEVKFASEQLLMEKLSLTPGVVSLFGLLHNAEHDVTVCFDKQMLDEHTLLTFHPNENTATVFIKNEDAKRFISQLGNKQLIIDL